MGLFNRKTNFKKFTNRKLYERLILLHNQKSPDPQEIQLIHLEISQRDPAEFEAEKIEADVAKSKRHMVMESTDIIYLEIKHYEDYLDKPESETDPYKRKLSSAILEMVHKELGRRKK